MNLWDLAKNPDALAQQREHIAIARRIDLVDELEGEVSLIARVQLADAEESARSLAEAWRGSKNASLQYDDAWVAMRRHDYARAITILEPLTKEVGATMFFSQQVWMRLAECYVRLERSADEIHAYDEVLARSFNEAQRATPMMNQGEAMMRMGDAEGALAQFREVARVSTAADLSILTQWDIALALDRAGDFVGALQASLTAVHMSKSAVLFLLPINPGVYFVPAYERDWYLALAELALSADSGTNARSVAEHLKKSETYMMTYVSGATSNPGDQWLDLARKRLDEIRRRRAAAEKVAGALKPQVDVDL